MYRQYPAALQVWSPAAVVGERRVQAVAAIDEHHRQWRLPVPAAPSDPATDHGTTTSSRPAASYIAAKLPERIHDAASVVIQLGVVEKLALLVLFRTAVMIQGEHGVAGLGQARPR